MYLLLPSQSRPRRNNQTMKYQIRDEGGMYPSTDRFETVSNAVSFIETMGDEDVTYFIVHVDGATIAIYHNRTVFVPRHADHWTFPLSE